MARDCCPNPTCSKCDFAVGDKVRVRDSVRDPQYGWGDVDWGDVGVVVSIKGEICLVSFPSHFGGFPLWKGAVHELQYVEDIGMFRGLIDINQRLFANRCSQDIVIEAADGIEHAHKSMLMAASDVFVAMFTQSMREGQTGRMQLPECKRVALRVFLRLLYTGLTDPEDWLGPSSGKAGDEQRHKGDATPTIVVDRAATTSAGRDEQLPLEHLLTVSALARKYMVAHVLDAATEALKLRLYKAAAENNMAEFEEIWKQAIVGGIDAVRMAAVQMVKDTTSADEAQDEADHQGDDDDDNPTEIWGARVRTQYEARALCAEILFELQVLWPPPVRPRKYRRLV